MENSVILNGIKEAFEKGQATINLREASTLTGSGSGVGGRVIYDDAFASLRYANPLRKVSRVINTIGSDEAFVVKKGDATLIQRDRKSTRLNSSHMSESRMPSSA